MKTTISILSVALISASCALSAASANAQGMPDVDKPSLPGGVQDKAQDAIQEKAKDAAKEKAEDLVKEQMRGSGTPSVPGPSGGPSVPETGMPKIPGQ